jgi:selenocysteine-specific elongation factor
VNPSANRLEAAALKALRERGLDPSGAADIASRINAREEDARDALDALVLRGEAVLLARPPEYVDAAAARAAFDGAHALLEAAQRAEPWAMGVTSIALARALELQETLLVRVLAAFVDDGRLANRAGYYATLDHQPTLTPEQRALIDAAVPAEAAQPFLPAAFDAVLGAVKGSRVEGAQKAFDTQLARGELVRVGSAIYRGSQIAQIKARVEAYLQDRDGMTAAEFRDLLGTSRKYAVPLLEWLDARGVTVRSGDLRSLRKSSP